MKNGINIDRGCRSKVGYVNAIHAYDNQVFIKYGESVYKLEHHNQQLIRVQQENKGKHVISSNQHSLESVLKDIRKELDTNIGGMLSNELAGEVCLSTLFRIREDEIRKELAKNGEDLVQIKSVCFLDLDKDEIKLETIYTDSDGSDLSQINISDFSIDHANHKAKVTKAVANVYTEAHQVQTQLNNEYLVKPMRNFREATYTMFVACAVTILCALLLAFPPAGMRAGLGVFLVFSGGLSAFLVLPAAYVSRSESKAEVNYFKNLKQNMDTQQQISDLVISTSSLRSHESNELGVDPALCSPSTDRAASKNDVSAVDGVAGSGADPKL